MEKEKGNIGNPLILPWQKRWIIPMTRITQKENI